MVLVCLVPLALAWALAVVREVDSSEAVTEVEAVVESPCVLVALAVEPQNGQAHKGTYTVGFPARTLSDTHVRTLRLICRQGIDE